MSEQTTDRQTDPSSVQQPGTHHRRRSSRRGSVLSGLLILFILIGAGWGAWWYLALRFEESTDDAYTAGNAIRVMPQISGKITAVLVDDHDMVTAGQPLVRIDPVDSRLAYERSLVDLAAAVRETCRMQAQLRESEARIAMRRVDLRQQADNLARRETLGRRNAIGMEELRHARDSMENASSALAAAQEERNALTAMLQGKELAGQPAVRQAAAVVRNRWLELWRTTVHSPVTGQVAKRNAQAGEVVSPNTPLLVVVPLSRLWVDANFKEMQLRRMRIGQPAVVRADMYGSTVTYHGRVAGFSAGTGSVFSLLPPQNATGNWIKIVQRVPVRIELDPAEVAAHPLLVGLSMLVEVDTRDTAGPLLARAPRTQAAPADLLSLAPEADFAEVEAIIAKVIEENALPAAADAKSAGSGRSGAGA